ncbi:glutamyl aminopeptidase-like [Lineus longissimus]|uniref:glutamyl aminopeptidase-like n=1 Tax=Lineus longissimus TaxID=88925 RepID=UPI00315C9299
MGSDMVCSRSRIILFTLFWIIVVIAVGLSVHFGIPCPTSGNAAGDSSGNQGGGTTDAEPWKELRLPRHILPKHYDLTLHPDFYDKYSTTFSGSVTIDLEITKDAPVILIHIKDLTITKTEVKDKAGNSLAIAETSSYIPNQFWVIKMKEPIKKGEEPSLTLDFNGSLVNGIVGFYKSTYVNSKTNETRYLATSKFEPVDARKAFPCFDEPNIKAPYTTTLVHRSDYIALSNMPIQTSTTRSDGLVVSKFERSVPMSTYLACFIVCDFEYKNVTTKRGTEFRVYATPDKIDQVDYALTTGSKVFDLYEIVFNSSYPLPKQDMIAIPDFVSGAMEHWGLITYRETNILYDEAQASQGNKQRVASVIAHELAHQWFGNIVTMDWWDDLWLNEGFASYMEYKGVMEVEPGWDMGEQFLTTDMQPVMIKDSSLTSHPIVVPVDSPDQITEVFDSISYSKGASVIRMLDYIMSEEDFYYGIQTYLKRFEYGNAKTDDLWAELQKAPGNSGRPAVKTIMDTWTRQMGFPVVTISFPSSTKVRATQKRFLLDPSANTTGDTSPFGYKWYVPLTYETSKGVTGQKWIEGDEYIEFDAPIDPASSTEWIKFNVNQTAFYRVNYPAKQWKILSDVLETSHQSISVADRSGLVDDAFNLASAEEIPMSTLLNMVKYLKSEEHYLPWSTAKDGLSYIRNMLEFTNTYGKWRTFVVNMVQPAMTRLGWNNTGTHLEKLSRTDIISLSCAHDEPSCLANAESKLQGWMERGEIIHPNLRSLVYKYGMRKSGGRKEWDFMWNQFTTTTSPQERIKLLYGMASTSETWLLKRFLDYASDPAKIRDQDFFSVISYMTNNPVGMEIVWDYVRQNYEALTKRFGLGNRYFGRMVPRIIEHFTTEFQLKQAEDFFAKYPDAGAGERARAQALEQINSNIYWIKTHESTIRDWLNTQ